MTTRTIRETESAELFEHYPAGYYAVFSKILQEPSFAFGTDSKDELLELNDDDFNFAVEEMVTG